MSDYGYFEYREKRSTDFGLFIDPNLTYTSPTISGGFEEVPGLDGEVFLPNGNLKNTTKTFGVYVVPMTTCTLQEQLTSISNWLKKEVGWSNLIFSGDPKFVYPSIYTEAYEVLANVETFNKAVLTFTCKPYKYLLSGLNERVIQSKEVLTNEGSRPSKPLLTIKGTGDIQVRLGRQTIYLKSIDEGIVIDSLSESAYHPRTREGLWNKMFTYPFPKLETGKSIISWTGNVEEVKIIPRWEVLVG